MITNMKECNVNNIINIYNENQCLNFNLYENKNLNLKLNVNETCKANDFDLNKSSLNIYDENTESVIAKDLSNNFKLCFDLNLNYVCIGYKGFAISLHSPMVIVDGHGECSSFKLNIYNNSDTVSDYLDLYCLDFLYEYFIMLVLFINMFLFSMFMIVFTYFMLADYGRLGEYVYDCIHKILFFVGNFYEKFINFIFLNEVIDGTVDGVVL